MTAENIMSAERVLLLCSVLVLACEGPIPLNGPRQINDQCARERMFLECMDRIPIGPTHVVANDWDEVITACKDVAFYQSLRASDQVKPECSSE